MERAGRIEMLLELLKTEPDDLFLNYALGLEYATDLLTVDEAEKQFKKVLALDSGYISAYYQLGKLFESQLKNTEALTYYKKGHQKSKEQKDLKSAGEFEEAIFLLEES